MNLIFAAGILLSVGSLWLMPFASYVMQAACFFTTGFFVFGPQMLIGMAAAECSHKEAAGAATGFVGLFAYLGASLSGWPLAKVLEIWHWTGFCGHRHRGGDLRAIAVAISERSGPARDQRSVMHLTFCAEWGKTKKFSRFCSDAVAGHFSCGFLQCLPFAGIKISSGVIHAGLLKPVRKPTSICRSMCGVKCGSSRSCSPIWWFLSAT